MKRRRGDEETWRRGGVSRPQHVLSPHLPVSRSPCLFLLHPSSFLLHPCLLSRPLAAGGSDLLLVALRLQTSVGRQTPRQECERSLQCARLCRSRTLA